MPRRYKSVTALSKVRLYDKRPTGDSLLSKLCSVHDENSGGIAGLQQGFDVLVDLLRINLVDLFCDRVSPYKLPSLFALGPRLEADPLSHEDVPFSPAQNIPAHWEPRPVGTAGNPQLSLVAAARRVYHFPDPAPHEELSVRILHLEDF